MAVVKPERIWPRSETCSNCGARHQVGGVTAIPPEFGPGWLCPTCRVWNELQPRRSTQ